MKRWICLLMVILMCVPLVAAAQGITHNYVESTPQSTDIAEEKAKEIALELALMPDTGIERSQVLDGYNYPARDLYGISLVMYTEFVRLEDTEQKAWIVSVFSGNEDGEAYECIGMVTVSSPSGDVLESVFGSQAAIYSRWKQDKGAYYQWNDTDLYWFDRLFEPKDTWFIAQMPTATDFTREKATELGVAAIARVMETTPEAILKEYKPIVKYCILSSDDPDFKVWFVGIAPTEAEPNNFNFRFHVELNLDGTVYREMDYTTGVG